MRKFKEIIIMNVLLIFMSFTASFSQTQPKLPTGTKAYSSSLFLAPDSIIWTGKTGSYTALAPKAYVDSVASAPIGTVLPSQLNLSTVGLPFLRHKVPTVVGGGGNNFTSGLIVSETANEEGDPNSIVRRWQRRIKAGNAVLPDEVITKFQLDSVIFNEVGVQPNNTRDTLSSPNSLLLYTDRSAIVNANDYNVIIGASSSSIKNGDGLGRNFISGSRDAKITTGVSSSAIIGSNIATINGNRQTSAIIASTNGYMEPWSGGIGTQKWNSALVATLNSVIQSSNSYVLVTGKGNISNGSAQLVAGQNNLFEASRSVDDPLKKNFIVGNGTGSNGVGGLPTLRSNAFHVTQGGKAWVQNEMEVDAAGGALVLKSPNGTRYKITVSNTGTLTATQL